MPHVKRLKIVVFVISNFAVDFDHGASSDLDGLFLDSSIDVGSRLSCSCRSAVKLHGHNEGGLFDLFTANSGSYSIVFSNNVVCIDPNRAISLI